MQFPFSRLVVGLLCFLFARPAFAQTTNVTMLVPGFTVREVPVKLSNINSLRFSPDGTLTALGYNGKIYLLRDTNGDGLEDTATPYWDKDSISVPVGMAWSKQGLYVSSHGKVSLLRDTNGDGKADAEEVIASGWPETDVGTGGVDATSVNLDREGNVYFGLLTPAYSNPYRLKDGVSHYDLKGERGTIQKWNAKTHQRETVANGIRVPYALNFNRLGDLFVTDQEGETWCPNGNPLDELNHIIPGRNYGFPPRHDQYLPNLISEPPVIGFGPQHQSSCGFTFNEPSKQQKLFGLGWWDGDALVAGESRGKIWRVKMVKTAAGYVGQEAIIARLGYLTTDVAISPKGDLYVSTHSGNPDWGTGPNGEGKIFKISYTGRAAPQPVATWATGPMEVRVAFDRAIDPAVTNRVGEFQIEFGAYVRAADRLEVLKPPYAAVNRQEATPRGKLRVVGAKMSKDNRTLILTTDPHPQSVHYSLMLTGIRGRQNKDAGATVDLDYTLNGVTATWTAEDADKPALNVWLPHFDAKVNSAFLESSMEQQQLFEATRYEGSYRLQTRLVLPAGTNWLRVKASSRFTLAAEGTNLEAKRDGSSYAVLARLSSIGQPNQIALEMATQRGRSPDIEVSYSSESDPTVRPLPFGRLLAPWAPAPQPEPVVSEEKTELAGGDFERGRDLFNGKQLNCVTCHRIRGNGALTGPDLSNLAQRDAASVLRDIKEPSASINPDYVAYVVTLEDGRDLTGFVRAQNERTLRIIDATGKEVVVPRKDVKEMHPSAVSLMPAGLLAGLNDGQIKDLLTFLLHEPPKRTPAELEAVKPKSKPSASLRPLKVVLVASKQDHGSLQHDYPAWQTNWTKLFAAMPGVTVTSAWEWPSAAQFAQADLIVCYFWNHSWSAEQFAQLDAYFARGGGLGILHSATIKDKESAGLVARIGLAAEPGPSLYRHMPMTLKIVAPQDDPITHGFKQLTLLDEPYWPLFGNVGKVEVLATAAVDGEDRPLIWTYRPGQGRVFASIPSHYTWTWSDDVFRAILLRGLAWAAGEDADRFLLK